MTRRSQKEGAKKANKNEGANFSILDDELDGAAAAPDGPAETSNPVEEDDLGSVTPSALAEYIKGASCNFEQMMNKAMKNMLESLQKVEKALEFEGLRINDLEQKNKELKSRLGKMEKAYNDLEQRVSNQDREANKAERFSRRNNLRIVGIEESTGDQTEDCVVKVEDILSTKFNMNIKVERAHRDGKKGDKPRHILVKTLSIREKVDIMKKSREALNKEKYYIVDDLTLADLTEKKKYKKQVQDLFMKGTKLRFYAGVWRGDGGVPYFSA